MNDIKFISPFKRMCITIGNLPTAYMESMSYYECITFLLKFLENEVIPTVNNNSEVVKELQEYVSTYFDDLNIQKEINKKLDDMAESGQLTEIIAQYLETSAIIGFNDKLSLKEADNLIEGSFVKTLGELNYDDGNGNFYKIRNKTEEDIIDDDLIVGLTNFPLLVAEKIIDYKVNENTQNINSLLSRVSNNETEINKLEKGFRGIMAISKDLLRGDDHYLYYSDDGINFFQVGNKINNITSDSSALFKINGIYYYLGNNTYQYSTDLLNWTSPVNIINNPPSNVWASTLYYDENDDIVYIYSSYRYNSSTFTNDVGSESYYFKIVYQTAVINEDGSLDINQTINDLLYTNNESFIDPYIIKHDTFGYLMACKNESTAQIEIYSLLSPMAINTKIRTIKAVGLEAPQLIIDGCNEIILYCHDYAMSNNFRTNSLDINIQTYNVIQLSYDSTILPEERLGLKPCNSPITFRHAGLCMCNDYDYQKIVIQGIKMSLLANNSRYYTCNNGCMRIQVNSDTHNIINYPNVIYQFGGGTINTLTANICAYFIDTPLKINVGDTKILWTGDVATFAKNKILINDVTTSIDNMQFTLQPPSENLDYGFLVPFNEE